MKKFYVALSMIFLAVTGWSQARLVIGDGVGIKMNGGSSSDPLFIVVDNPNANAITDGGVPGGSVFSSENEYHCVKWNIGASTGTYRVPFLSITSGSAAAVDIQVGIGTAGDAGGALEFSTYPTNSANTPWPVDVNHLAHFPSTLPETTEANTVDRFWIVNPDGVDAYSTKPALSSITVGIDASETDGIADPTNVVLQRFNPTAGTDGAWLDYLPISSYSASPSPSITATGISSANFYRSWAVSSADSPLPIELLSFKADCDGASGVRLDWSTASEINNSHFVIQRSEDGIVWETINDYIPAAGNSSTQRDYSFVDNNPFRGLTYYLLTQVDFDGTSETFDPIVSDCDGVGFEIINVFSEDGGDQIQMTVSAGYDENFVVEMIDMNGRSVLNQNNVILNEGLNYFTIDRRTLSFGMYVISMRSADQVLTRKIALN